MGEEAVREMKAKPNHLCISNQGRFSPPFVSVDLKKKNQIQISEWYATMPREIVLDYQCLIFQKKIEIVL